MSSQEHVSRAIFIPKALEALTPQKRWIVWRWTTGANGKPTKPPFRADNPKVNASCADPATWFTFDEATRAHQDGSADGIGFALRGSGILAFDLDDCRDPNTSALKPWAVDLVQRCKSYTEVTPSGAGLRIIGTTTGADLHRKFAMPEGGSLEVYANCSRFICVTGKEIEPVDGLADLGAIAQDIVAERDTKKMPLFSAKAGGAARERGLDDIIKHGCGSSFGGDRSRAVWYVVNALIERGRNDGEIATVLLNPDNGISAHVLSKPEDPRKYVQRQIAKARSEQAQKKGAGGDGSLDSDGAEINRLAALSDMQYEKARKAAAEALGVRAAILDRLVQAERERGRLGADKKAGRAISFPTPEPWPQPVEGHHLLDGIADAIRGHITMTESETWICALWVVQTYLVDCFQVSPRLAIQSPTKGCGKTSLFDVLACLVARPLVTASVTPAVVFRVVENYRPTLMVDEGDTFLHEASELRGILNSGYRKGGTVLRTVGDDFEVRAFSTYGACAFASIRGLPDTLADRSISIELNRRRKSDPPITAFSIDRTAHLDVLARQASRWAEDNAVTVAAAAADNPALPEGLSNRVADNWRVLAAIASGAGGDWPQRAFQAAELAHSKIAAHDGDGILEMLLTDIREAFPSNNADMASADLVERLVAIEGHPWAEFGKSAKPITMNRLARLLKPLRIGPENIGQNRVKGYRREQFKEAFERYLPQDIHPEGAQQPLNRSSPCNAKTFRVFQPLMPEQARAVVKPENHNDDKRLSGCAVALGDDGGKLAPEVASGLSQRSIHAESAWYRERAYDRMHEPDLAGEGTLEAAIDAEMRARLSNGLGILPEHVETELQRVKDEAFKPL